MQQIAEKYRALKPTIEYLSDEVVMAQAWKKTHGYIRSFNWYADTLALDVSALGIEENAKNWASQIKTGQALYPLELIPAAKSEDWVFDDEGWHPANIKKRNNIGEKKGKIPLRPLAHLTIRDQTWASAAMLCLADAVETYQGDCSTHQSFETARAKHVYSYGNRLVCNWNKNEEGKAWFRWGNSETYRKFFTDYQSFLKRPIELGRLVSSQDLGSDDVYIVSLDLSKFYNTIDINILINRLKDISTEFGHKNCDQFWNSFKHITDWKWSEEDLIISKRLNLGDIETGLPQGLVSAGFYANAYLAKFDKEVGKKLGEKLPQFNHIILHDYCRYVDDIRIVVSAENLSSKKISDKVEKLITNLLSEFGGDQLSINSEKTKISLLSDLDNSSSMANRIEMIQNELSGPADRDILDSATGVLENLLFIEEENTPNLLNNHQDFALLQVSNIDHDIRPDTLKRFAANRLESIVRSKRRITSFEDSQISSGISKKQNESDELLAKKLILAWMKDPSLGLVLRKAIEIYPNADLFEPVFDAIFERSNFINNEKKHNEINSAIMDYLLADLFRSAIDFNGYFQVIFYPPNIEPTEIIELISRYAQKVLVADKSFMFVTRQALMLLAVINKPVLIKLNEKSIQQALHSILVSNPRPYHPQRSALFEVAAQITGYFDTYTSLFLENIAELGDNRYIALEVFAKRGGPFWLSLWKQLNRKSKFNDVLIKFKWAAPQVSINPKPRKQLLSKVIASDINGFEFEHALIKLALGLVDLSNKNSKLISKSPNEIKVKLSEQQSWDKVWHPEVKEIICEIVTNKNLSDPRFLIPDWIDVQTNEDNELIYWIGMILRASVLGGADFTGNRWKKGKIVTYKGLRTSWYKRRMGMMHSPEFIVGEFATVSEWMSDLLIRCLQWPGFESSYVRHDDIHSIIDLNSFLHCLTNRLSYLNSLMCQSSSLPVLPTKVSHPNNNKNFRIVTIQQLLPRKADFNLSDVPLNNPVFRAKHRDHLLSVCQLTTKTLEAKLNCDEDKKKPSADLIVFPEVSVHIDDQDILKRLADKTQAIIFAGLVFTDHKGKLVNIARWFIPDYRESGRQWIIRDQGKEHITDHESKMNITSYRPCQHILQIEHPEGSFNITGAICYDATDIRLAADLKPHTDLFVVVAHNQDVSTFDNMASALQYHMYQHVVISNIGEFGGSTIQAPFKEKYHQLISHAHGAEQIAISTADIDLAAFKRNTITYKEVKTKPAGI